ncbi:hypothetical protein ACHAXR_007315, partial [Thalassiosira sp. AJA248-18]
DGNNSLSNDEVDSAHRSLNQIIRTAESIKEKLPSSITSEEIDDITSNSEESLTSRPPSASLGDQDEKTIDGGDKTKPPESQNKPSGANDNEVPQRRLSTPCLIPMDTTGHGKGHRPSKARQKPNVSFFVRGQPAVHPQNEDIETGSGRRIRFSKAPRRKGSELGAWKMTAREAFRIIDENGDGFLQKEEVVRAIEMMAQHGEMNMDGMSSLQLAEKMMGEVDTDGDGQIDMDEFTQMMKNTSTGLGKANGLTYNHRMSQLAKNVLIAHQKKIENSIIGEDMWMIHPLSNFHAAWDILVSVLILLTVVTMPLSLGWEQLNEYFFGMNLAVDFIFLLDVCKNFCTGFVDENEAIIMNAELVRKNYLTGFFITDFCSSIPLDLLLKSAGVDSVGGTVTGAKQSLKMLKLLRMAKLFRLFRINRLFLHVKRVVLLIEEKLQFRISDGFTKLLRLGMGALILAHWIGCFNFLLVGLHDFPPDSWVVYAGLENERPYIQWSWSFFKALAQMIMIGFETPPFTNVSCDALSDWCTIEYWTTLGCLYLGAIFYSLLISSISSILQTANQSSRQFDEHLLRIDDYMRTKKLPSVMREKVKDYFYLQFSDGKLHKEDEIFDFLSPVLRREIKQFTGRDICRKVPLLSIPSSKDFAQDISCVIEPTIVFANEVIMREQTTGDEMFFICSGVVEIYVSSFKCASYLAIGDGCYFGEVSVLLGVRRTASAKSKTQCMLYRLRKSSLLSLLRDYPVIESKMTDVAQSRRRRLAHYLEPNKVALSPGDEVDAEDSKTALFGRDADQILHDKEEEMNLERIHSGIKPKRKTTVAMSPDGRRNANITKHHMPVTRRGKS